MKILFLLSQRPDSTGSGIYTRSLIDCAAAAGHRCSLVAAVSSTDQLDIGCLKTDHANIVRFNDPPLDFLIPGMSDVMPYPSSRFIDMTENQLKSYEEAFAAEIQDAVAQSRPDIIHSNHLWLLTALTRRLFPEIPLIGACHGTDLRQFRNCHGLREKLIPGIKKLDAILALTKVQKKEISDLYGIDERKIHVVRNGFSPEVFYPAPKPEPQPLNLIYAGKLSSSKGLPLLLECLAGKRLGSLPIHLHIAGSGSGLDLELCHSLADRIKDRVTFYGSLAPQDLGSLMRKSHLFVLPSFFEGLPLVIIEALASGCRIVATDLPGIREIKDSIDGDWGQLIKLPDLETSDKPFEKDIPLIIDRLAKAIETQILKFRMNSAFDSELFVNLDKKYSWRSIFGHVESVYQAVLKK